MNTDLIDGLGGVAEPTCADPAHDLAREIASVRVRVKIEERSSFRPGDHQLAGRWIANPAGVGGLAWCAEVLGVRVDQLADFIEASAQIRRAIKRQHRKRCLERHAVYQRTPDMWEAA